MLIVRFAAIFLILAVFVLLAAYIFTRDKKYLRAIRRMLIYTAWLVVLLALFMLIARVIRI